jgi:hypothetical protein
VGHAQFFGVVHGAAGGLLAVAQGGVEEEDAVVGWRAGLFAGTMGGLLFY